MQTISGILVIDKPENMTSAGVTNRLKRISGIRKTGHTGTLDPFASGVLVCTINQATRLSRFFLNSDKKYTVVMVLGVETDTQDATGTILKTAPCGHVTEKEILEAFKRFEGDIRQVPPVFSALKHNGIPLYRYARKGMPVVKPARPVSISYITLTSVNLPEVGFEVCCSSGTYIRTLCADIGSELGCGGHLKTLRRIESGGFGIHEAMTLGITETHKSLDTLKNEIVGMSESLKDMDAIVAGNALKEKIRYGKMLTSEDIQLDAGGSGDPFIKVVDTENRLLAVIQRDERLKRYNYCCVFVNP
jgi:tRNA pseudouridine55 synthase